jgi:hypothetical protein
MELRSIIDIRAGIDDVWSLTEAVESWPETTPTITSVERLDAGPLRVGSTARIKQPRQRPRVWTVQELEAPRRFVWGTTMGPITMVGGHLIEPTPEGCRNTLTLELGGLGHRLLGLVAGRQLQRAIDTENAGFKARAEVRSTTES